MPNAGGHVCTWLPHRSARPIADQPDIQCGQPATEGLFVRGRGPGHEVMKPWLQGSWNVHDILFHISKFIVASCIIKFAYVSKKHPVWRALMCSSEGLSSKHHLYLPNTGVQSTVICNLEADRTYYDPNVLSRPGTRGMTPVVTTIRVFWGK